MDKSLLQEYLNGTPIHFEGWNLSILGQQLNMTEVGERLVVKAPLTIGKFNDHNYILYKLDHQFVIYLEHICFTIHEIKI